jgi:hypothetical protein
MRKKGGRSLKKEGPTGRSELGGSQWAQSGQEIVAGRRHGAGTVVGD